MTLRLLSTRTRGGIKYRRYDAGFGVRFTTAELPMTVLKAVGSKRVMEQFATWSRGHQGRMKSAQLRQAIIERLPAKPTAIAHELGCSETYVRMIRKELLK